MVGVSEPPLSLPLMPTGSRFQLSVCNCIWGFAGSRQMLLLWHREEDLPWDPPFSSQLRRWGTGWGRGWSRARRSIQAPSNTNCLGSCKSFL